MRMGSKLAARAAFLASLFVPAALVPATAADPAPVIVYGAAPAIVALAPTGYVLDPSDARQPVYVVNQGPVHGAWVGALAQPTYSEGGYIYLDDVVDGVRVRSRRSYPYVRSYQGGRWFEAPGGRHPHVRRYGDATGGPAAAYRYRPAPDARVIRVPPRPVEMHTSYRPR